MSYTYKSIKMKSSNGKLIDLSVTEEEYMALRELAKVEEMKFRDLVDKLLETDVFKILYKVTYRFKRLVRKELIVREWYIDETHPKSHRRVKYKLSDIVDRSSINKL